MSGMENSWIYDVILDYLKGSFSMDIINLMSTTVYKFRLYCTTQAQQVYVWSTSVPTLCPNSASHTIDTSSISVIDSISTNEVSINNLSKGPGNESRTMNKSICFDIKSFAGITTLREKITQTGTASVSSTTEGEIMLKVQYPGDVASSATKERSSYTSGLGGECGIGIRIPTALTGDQVLRWGMCDGIDGMYFHLSSSGLKFALLRNSVETVHDLNGEPIDGSGSNGMTLNMARGNVFLIEYSWYGFGSIEFKYQSYDPSGKLVITNAAIYVTNGQTSIRNPNLPLMVKFSANTTTGLSFVYLTGRQYSLIGDLQSSTRCNGATVLNVSCSSTTSLIPLLSFRKINGYYLGKVKLVSADFICSTDQYIEVRTECTLTSSSFANITDSESCVEVDTSSTAASGGYVVWKGLVTAGQPVIETMTNTCYSLFEGSSVTVFTKGVSSSSGVCSCVIRWEEWW